MILLALLLAQPKPAEDWICIYPSYTTGKPISVNFRLEAGLLKQRIFDDAPFEAWGSQYVVVHDADDAIIATYPSVGMAGDKRIVTGRTITIDRLSGDMVVANISLWAPISETRLVSGTCAPKKITPTPD
ncbi:hypothetical protein [Sphingorhabdus sp.]|uniref:hypothetical protein n=1 Tax=Sphingorhabdus sp. TaxID=1902408 RepID=UPI003BAEBFED